MSGAGDDPILRVRDLSVRYPRAQGARRGRGPVDAVDGVDLELARGETLALVGESGSGKSSLVRALLRLGPHRGGEAWFAPEPRQRPVDLLRLGGRALRRLRPALQVVFQDPVASLNPRLTVGAALAEPLVVHRGLGRSAVQDRVRALLAEVGLAPALAGRFPHALSGGQRQRVGLARALACEPRLLLLDEPLSALDVSVQAQVLNLLVELRRSRGLSYLFVTHDLSVVQYIADRVAVLFQGRVVERGRTDEVFERAAHPYTQALLAARPAWHPRARRDVEAAPGAGVPAAASLEGPAAPAASGGCHFRARCPVAEARCERSYPPLDPLSPTHAAACHLLQEPSSPS